MLWSEKTAWRGNRGEGWEKKKRSGTGHVNYVPGNEFLIMSLARS